MSTVPSRPGSAWPHGASWRDGGEDGTGLLKPEPGSAPNSNTAHPDANLRWGDALTCRRW